MSMAFLNPNTPIKNEVRQYSNCTPFFLKKKLASLQIAFNIPICLLKLFDFFSERTDQSLLKIKVPHLFCFKKGPPVPEHTKLKTTTENHKKKKNRPCHTMMDNQ